MGNIVEFTARTSIEHQAREWLIRMDGDEPLSSTERQAFQDWIRRNELHREEITRLARFWSQASILTELGVCTESATLERTRRRVRRVVSIAVAASVLVTAITLVGRNQYHQGKTVNGNYETLVGQQKTIFLSDGSSVQLNTDSQVHVVYSSESREIRLLRGEALFSAAPDPSRPFEVHVANRVIRAIGTAFAIHLEGSTVDVTVTNGVVDLVEAESTQAVARPKPLAAAPLTTSSLGRLKAGEATRVSSESDHLEVRRVAEPEMQRRMAWHEGYLAFAGEPLSEVVAQVNRYSQVTLEIGDPKLASITIGGRFRIGDLDAILDVLHTSFGIEAHHVDTHSIRLESEHRR